MEVAKALGGSFKLVTLVPKTVREMTQLPPKTQNNWDTKSTNKHTKQKPRLNMHKKTCFSINVHFWCYFVAELNSHQRSTIQ